MHRIKKFLFGSKKRSALTAVSSLALIAVAVAAAAWLTSGTGAGHGRAGSLQPLTVTANNTTPLADPVFPGNTAEAAGGAMLNVFNPNTVSLNVIDAQFSGGDPTAPGAVVSDNEAQCPSQYFSVATTGVITITGQPVAANNTTPVEVPGILALRPDAPNSCQGVGATINVITITASTS